jgi:hypothetical protein
LGEEIAALAEAANERDFWDGVSAGYADVQWATGPEVVQDEYPEYAHLGVGDIPAEGPHNEAPPSAAAPARNAA